MSAAPPRIERRTARLVDEERSSRENPGRRFARKRAALYPGVNGVSYQLVGNVVLPGDVRQAHVAALEEEREPLVVEAQELEAGGVQVVDVDLVLDGAEAHFV